MGFKVGHKKIGGRKKGAKNKDSIPLAEKAAELNVDPFEILLLFAKGDWESLGYESNTKVIVHKSGETSKMDVITPDHRLKAASEAAQYLYPKLKSIEGEIDVNGKLETNVVYNTQFSSNTPAVQSPSDTTPSPPIPEKV